jgi:acyl transferase domain-containing protein
MFSGQGAQRVGMGRGLAARFPVFAQALGQVCEELDRFVDRPVREVLFAAAGSELAGLLDETVFTQVGLFAVEVALFRLLESWSVSADFVCGHSVGGITAAYVAGVMSLPDAARVVAARGALMQGLAVRGAMVSVQAGEAEVLESLEEIGDCADRMAIAAVNGPNAVVVSGVEDAVTEFAGNWLVRGRKVRRLRVSHAFHSPLMRPMLAEFEKVMHGVALSAPAIPVVSDSTGRLLTQEQATSPRYWAEHIVRTVRFQDATTYLAEQGVTTFVEIGPSSVLAAAAHVTLAESGRDAMVVPALRMELDEPNAILEAAAKLFVSGRTIDWTSVLRALDVQGRRVLLPTYAFRRERFWLRSELQPDTPANSGESLDDEFWQVVENGDAQELMATLTPAADMLSVQDCESMLSVLSSWHRTRRARSAVDRWRYRVLWKPSTRALEPALSGRWLVVAPTETGPADDCVAALRDHGADVVAIRAPRNAEAADRTWWRAALADAGSLDGVVSLLGLDDQPHPQFPSLSQGLATTVALVQGLGDAEVGAPLWCLTQSAISVGGADDLAAPAQALIWGLGRVVALEHPQRWGGLIDLPSAIDTYSWQQVCGLLAGDGAEDQVAVRSAGIFLRRLVPASAKTGRRGEWTPAGTVLITGGTGALGAHTARWIAGYGTAARIVLLSRGGPDAPGAQALVDELVAVGVPTEVVACDVTDRAALTRVLDTFPAEHPLTAVFHTAGVSDTAPVTHLDVESFARTLDAKVGGAQILHDVLAGRAELDRLVMFSSGAGVWGGGGQGAYSAGNAFLDALAEHRRGNGLPATAVAWGPWADSGMVDEAGDRDLDRRGLRTMAPDAAITALRTALETDEVTVTVADVDWGRFHSLFAMARPRPLLHDIPAVAEQIAEGSHSADGSVLAQQLAGLDATRQHDAVLGLVKSHAAAVLGHAGAGAISSTRAFLDLGFDSLTAVELRNRLNAATGLRLPATLVFDCPTPDAMAATIREMAVGADAADDGPPDQKRFWSALENVTYEKLLESGVVTAVLDLLGDPEETRSGPEAAGAYIDEMDVGELLSMAAKNRAARNLATDAEGVD